MGLQSAKVSDDGRMGYQKRTVVFKNDSKTLKVKIRKTGKKGSYKCRKKGGKKRKKRKPGVTQSS